MRSMPGAPSIFIDSNILVYAYDASDVEKQTRAEGIIDGLWADGRGALSTQVLQEFYHNVTRKIRTRLTRDSARAAIHRFAQWPLQQIGPTHILRASEIEEQHQLSFWDALIVSAAVSAGAETILSEDLNPGHVIAGVRIVNPFAAAAA